MVISRHYCRGAAGFVDGRPRRNSRHSVGIVAAPTIDSGRRRIPCRLRPIPCDAAPPARLTAAFSADRATVAAAPSTAGARPPRHGGGRHNGERCDNDHRHRDTSLPAGNCTGRTEWPLSSAGQRPLRRPPVTGGAAQYHHSPVGPDQWSRTSATDRREEEVYSAAQ